MIALKVTALLALALVAYGSDLDEGLKIMACAKKAISVGVEELNIPTHEPYVVIKHNFSWAGKVAVASVKVNVTQMTWAGLARWDLSAKQLSNDSDPYAVFDFDLHWKWLQINGSYNAEEKELFLHQHQHGRFSIDWTHSTWSGSINVTKPTETSNGTVNSMKVDWHVKDVDIEFHGLGVFDKLVASRMAKQIKESLNNKAIGNAVGDFLKMRLETVWWNTGKVWQLMDWCNSQNQTLH